MSSFNWAKLNINVDRISSEGKTTCPKCGPTRKNKRDKSLSVNVITGDYCCHNSPCDFKGNAGYDKLLSIAREKKEFKKPLPKLQKVCDRMLKWFESRGISNNTLLHMKVTEEPEEWMPQTERKHRCICFNYHRNEDLINIKFRTGEKHFKMSKDAELIFYNLDCLREKRKLVVIVEGEVDVLTWIESGVYAVISVPNGATLHKDVPKLEYIDNCWRELQNAEKFLIATDGDEAGQLLGNELIRRLGPEKCWRVNYPQGCKDSNEVMLLGCKNIDELIEKHGIQGIARGKEAVRQLVETATEVPIDGVLTLENVKQAARAIYEYGYPKTLRLDWALDKWITWRMGECTVVTGIPNHGKSTWLNSLIVELAKKHGWVIAIFSPEKNPIEMLVAELAGIYIGMAYYKADPHEKMTNDQWNEAMAFISDHFLFIQSEEDMTLDELLIIAHQLVYRYGINGIVADPWNYFEHDLAQFESETAYVSRQLGKVSKFVKRVNVHMWLVAHPTKMPMAKRGTEEVRPRLYDISGSAHWKNKIDNGIIVYRDYKRNRTIIIVEKVRWFFVGRGGGSVEMIYDTTCQRFADAPAELSPEQATYEEKKANMALHDIGRKLIPMPQLINFDGGKDDLPF